MILRKPFLVLVALLGVLAISEKEAAAATCSFENYWELDNDARTNTMNDCLASWHAPKIMVLDPFEWVGIGNLIAVLELLDEDVDAWAVFNFHYDLALHGLTSSLDQSHPGTVLSSFSFTLSGTPDAPLYGIVEVGVSDMLVDKVLSFSSVTFNYILAEEVILAELIDSKSLFLSYFANADSVFNWLPVDTLGTSVRLSGMIAVVPIPLPPALPLLLGGLAGLGWLGRRQRAARAV